MKRFICALLACCAIAALTACKNEKETVETTADTTADTTKITTEVQTEEEKFSYSYTPAAVEQIELFKKGESGYVMFRIPSLLVTDKGTILAFAEARDDEKLDYGNIDLVLKRSLDGGKTWQKMQTVWDYGDDTAGNPTPVQDKETGRIFLFMNSNSAKNPKQQRYTWYTYSDDDGETWKEPICVSTTGRAGADTHDAVGPGNGIQLTSSRYEGRLVIPAQWRCFYSIDHGKTWQVSAKIPNASEIGGDEATIVELSSGILLRIDRSTETGCRLYSYSKDGGATWEIYTKKEALIEPMTSGQGVFGCQGSALIFETETQNYLLFSNPYNKYTRRNLSIQVSKNDGETYFKKYELCSGMSGYSSMAQIDYNYLGVLFEGGKTSTVDCLYFTVIKFEDIIK